MQCLNSQMDWEPEMWAPATRTRQKLEVMSHVTVPVGRRAPALPARSGGHGGSLRSSIHLVTDWRSNHDHQQTGVLLYHIYLFPYITCIMTLLFSIMTLLFHLFCCKCQDYYFSLFHYLQKDYCFTYDTSIISLAFIRIEYCHYCPSRLIILFFSLSLSQTIFTNIFFEGYYSPYLFPHI